MLTALVLLVLGLAFMVMPKSVSRGMMAFQRKRIGLRFDDRVERRTAILLQFCLGPMLFGAGLLVALQAL